MHFMMPQGKGIRGNGNGGGSRSSGRAPYSSSQEGVEVFDGPRDPVADADRSGEAIDMDDGHHHQHHDRHDHHQHQGKAKAQEEALRGRFSYLDIADRVKCLLTNADDHVRETTTTITIRAPNHDLRTYLYCLTHSLDANCLTTSPSHFSDGQTDVISSPPRDLF